MATSVDRQMTMVAFLQAQNCSNYPASWRHAATARLLDQTATPRLVRLFQWRVLVLAIVFGLSIPVALTLGVLLLSEPFTVGAGLGFVLILLGSYLATRRPAAATPSVETFERHETAPTPHPPRLP